MEAVSPTSSRFPAFSASKLAGTLDAAMLKMERPRSVDAESEAQSAAFEALTTKLRNVVVGQLPHQRCHMGGRLWRGGKRGEMNFGRQGKAKHGGARAEQLGVRWLQGGEDSDQTGGEEERGCRLFRNFGSPISFSFFSFFSFLRPRGPWRGPVSAN
jgi:hypothetical protein